MIYVSMFGFHSHNGLSGKQSDGQWKEHGCQKQNEERVSCCQGRAIFSDCDGEVFTPAKKEQGKAGIEF